MFRILSWGDPNGNSSKYLSIFSMTDKISLTRDGSVLAAKTTVFINGVRNEVAEMSWSNEVIPHSPIAIISGSLFDTPETYNMYVDFNQHSQTWKQHSASIQV